MSTHSGPPPRSADLVVAGAGPAGTAAAITACRRGLDVVVVDRARFPRDKCCGDGLTTSALRHLAGLGFDPAATPSWMPIEDVELRSPWGVTAVLPLPRGHGAYAAVCRRAELDAALVDLARRAGATILEGHEVTGVNSGPERVEITARPVDGPVGPVDITAPYLVAADGMWSPTRKLLGANAPGYRGEWHAFRHYMRDVSGEAGRHLVVWFEPDLLPGYAWSFPLADGAVNVGFGIQRGAGVGVQEMAGLWPELLQRPHIAQWLGPDARPEGRHKAWPIPARLGDLPPTVGRVFFAGDAAAATDPMTGEGIGQALATGMTAVTSLADAGPAEPDSAARRYRDDLTRTMVRDHRFARGLSTVLGNRWATEAAIRTVDSTGWTRRQFGRWLFEDYPRALVITPDRWNRSWWQTPGARFASPVR
ncbi:MAG: NAD(P)/FAD-dependent oxidoreductase [Acidimicrobiales bacterium]